MMNDLPGPSEEYIRRQMRGFDILSAEMRKVRNLVNVADKIIMNDFRPAEKNTELVEMLWSLVESMQLIAGNALEEIDDTH